MPWQRRQSAVLVRRRGLMSQRKCLLVQQLLCCRRRRVDRLCRPSGGSGSWDQKGEEAVGAPEAGSVLRRGCGAPRKGGRQK